ncbi:MAG: hypothetical protein KAI24_18445 [Planctomycetes bacterium]|nr:hypothetical protein [Planctomycetota bacterium]
MQKAQSLGLTEAELQLTELLGQVLELLRWNQVLGYSNQYLLHEKLGLTPEERHRVMKAAAGAVEQDGRMQNWGARLLEIQQSLTAIHERMTGERLEPLRPGESDPDDGDADAAEAANG